MTDSVVTINTDGERKVSDGSGWIMNFGANSSFTNSGEMVATYTIVDGLLKIGDDEGTENYKIIKLNETNMVLFFCGWDDDDESSEREEEVYTYLHRVTE